MDKNKFKRILILGGTGSGKTTLAKKVSEILNVSHIGLDWIVYKKHWTTRYSDKTIDKKIKEVVKKQKWVMEGVHADLWMTSVVKRADLIVILNPPKLILTKRVIGRYLKKKLNKPKKEQDRFIDTLKLLKFAHIYKKDNFVKHKNLIGKHKKQYLILENNKQVKQFLKTLK